LGFNAVLFYGLWSKLTDSEKATYALELFGKVKSMDKVTQLMNWLLTHKTYVVAVVTAGLGIAAGLGYPAPEWVYVVLAALGVGAVRAAVSKGAEATKEVKAMVQVLQDAPAGSQTTQTPETK
jgi:hypothetical protein